jgi:hypothetical protein
MTEAALADWSSWLATDYQDVVDLLLLTAASAAAASYPPLLPVPDRPVPSQSTANTRKARARPSRFLQMAREKPTWKTKGSIHREFHILQGDGSTASHSCMRCATHTYMANEN